jgi:LacI family transcriptional regulator
MIATASCHGLLHRMRARDRAGRVRDFPLADVLEPAVAVVAQDPVAIGRLAAEILFKRLEGDRSAAVEHVVPTTLVLRESALIAGPGR